MSNTLNSSNLTTTATYNNLFSTNPALAVIAAAAAARENIEALKLSELTINSFPKKQNSNGNGIFPSTSQLTSFKNLSRNPIFFQSQSSHEEFVFFF